MSVLLELKEGLEALLGKVNAVLAEESTPPAEPVAPPEPETAAPEEPAPPAEETVAAEPAS